MDFALRQLRWAEKGVPASADARMPYRSTPMFDEQTLSAALRKRPDIGMGQGADPGSRRPFRLTDIEPPSECILEHSRPGIFRPREMHLVRPLGSMKMQVDFYREPPLL
ncbi:MULTISPECIES: hypothetical protein [Sphingobium]|uniref:Uncharacterized protein n=1 Tax=Sphingobium agri TaxID=2933566 RepID=A0ABT0E1Q2_9SPHN|nr:MULTISPECIES: hypothetical protein [Sphingobium]MCK0533303.1 hypothetical protein [Sphingobium agri]